MKSWKSILVLALLCLTLLFAESALADPPKYKKNPDYITLNQQLNQLQTAKATQTPLVGHTLEEINQKINDLEFQKFAFESGIDWGQCSNQTGKTLAIYGTEPNLEDDDYSNGAALYFLGDGQTTKDRWNCKGIYLPADVQAVALGLNEQNVELTGGVVLKVLNGTKLVVKTNPDTSAIEFNPVGTQILKAGEVNWFIPNVSQSVIDAKVTTAPTKKA
ncbi:hypothetical protein MEO94_32235 [Dolichospermum sp. ST_sed9]|jgi:hypothetical protein|nr:hypothetical protein [Dolichospermum sp. ST_sed9]